MRPIDADKLEFVEVGLHDIDDAPTLDVFICPIKINQIVYVKRDWRVYAFTVLQIIFDNRGWHARCQFGSYSYDINESTWMSTVFPTREEAEKELNIQIKPYNGLPCCLEDFKINGQNAYVDDFGDVVKESTRAYSCDVVKFVGDPRKSNQACKKYNISSDQFYSICKELEEKLFVGGCSLCE